MRRWTLLGVALAACAEPDAGLPDACNPLGGQGCLLPWPSMAYTKLDAEHSATGYRLALPSEGMPVARDGTYLHPAPFNRWDGFSTFGPMIAMFGSGVSAAGLPVHAEASLAADSPIVVLDMTTGERAPIFAEVDDALIIRPIRRLRPGHRYAVAIRTSVHAPDGGPLVVPEGFAAIRDGVPSPLDAHPRFGELRARSGDIFAALAAAGVARNELVLAWDFVTASDDFVRSDLVAMRNQALLAIGGDGEPSTFALSTQPDAVFARYTGTFTAPNFLVGTSETSVLHRDEWEWDARPMQDGMRDARFGILVPPCVTTAALPRPVLLAGHALFGSLDAALDDPFVRGLATEHCAIAIASEHLGLTAAERGIAMHAMTNLGELPRVTDKLAQSTIDLVALAALIRGPLATQFAVDPASITYVGRSVGGIAGATYLAYEPGDVRAAIAPSTWAHSFARSPEWAELAGAMRDAYPDPAAYLLDLAIAIGMGFEPYDPAITAADITHDALLWSGIDDGFATEMLAREMRVPLLAPSVMAPWGIAIAGEAASSGLVIFDGERVEQTPALLRQIAQVIARAPLTMQCALGGTPAACDCATGACD